MERQESQWVHEDGYGSPAFGEIILGIIELVVLIVVSVITFVRFWRNNDK